MKPHDNYLRDHGADAAAELGLKVEALASLIRPTLQFAEFKEHILHDASHDKKLTELYESCFDPYKMTSFWRQAGDFTQNWLNNKALELAKETLSGRETKYTWLISGGEE